MKKSYAYLRITCNDKRERALIRERLAEVTPFYRKRKELRYMELASKEAMPIPEILDAVLFLLEEHMEKLVEVSRLPFCKPELVASSPAPLSLTDIPACVSEFMQRTGAALILNGEETKLGID